MVKVIVVLARIIIIHLDTYISINTDDMHSPDNSLRTSYSADSSHGVLRSEAEAWQ